MRLFAPLLGPDPPYNTGPEQLRAVGSDLAARLAAQSRQLWAVPAHVLAGPRASGGLFGHIMSLCRDGEGEWWESAL